MYTYSTFTLLLLLVASVILSGAMLSFTLTIKSIITRYFICYLCVPITLIGITLIAITLLLPTGHLEIEMLLSQFIRINLIAVIACSSAAFLFILIENVITPLLPNRHHNLQ